MAYQFNGFRATKPVVRLIDPINSFYEVFFIVYDHSDKRKFFRYKKEINNQKKSIRKKQAAAHAEVLWEELNNGWNPLQSRFPSMKREVKKNILLFGPALDLALERKGQILSKFSMYDYRGCVRFIKEAAQVTGHAFEMICELKRSGVRQIINEARERNNWSSKARNKYLSIFRSLLTVLEDEEIIEFNPARKIKDEPTEKTIGYKRLTDEEKERIANHLMMAAPDFFEYLMFIYDDGIRRKETLLLQIQDFNLTRNEIRIRAEVAKTNTERIVPITDTLMQIILRRQIWNYPPDYFLFSNNKFKPGPVAYHPNTPTSWWHKFVVCELQIDCKMYSLKHRGADDHIRAGTSLDALKTLYGHKSSLMTETYAMAIKEKYKQQIIDHAISFAKIVEMKRAK